MTQDARKPSEKPGQYRCHAKRWNHDPAHAQRRMKELRLHKETLQQDRVRAPLIEAWCAATGERPSHWFTAMRNDVCAGKPFDFNPTLDEQVAWLKAATERASHV